MQTNNANVPSRLYLFIPLLDEEFDDVGTRDDHDTLPVQGTPHSRDPADWFE